MGNTCSLGIVVADAPTTGKKHHGDDDDASSSTSSPLILRSSAVRRPHPHSWSSSITGGDTDAAQAASSPRQRDASAVHDVSLDIVDSETLACAVPRGGGGAPMARRCVVDRASERIHDDDDFPEDASFMITNPFNSPSKVKKDQRDGGSRGTSASMLTIAPPAELFPPSPRERDSQHSTSIMTGGGGAGGVTSDAHPHALSSGTSFLGSTSCTSHLSIMSRPTSPRGSVTSSTGGERLRVSFRSYALVMGHDEVLDDSDDQQKVPDAKEATQQPVSPRCPTDEQPTNQYTLCVSPQRRRQQQTTPASPAQSLRTSSLNAFTASQLLEERLMGRYQSPASAAPHAHPLAPPSVELSIAVDDTCVSPTQTAHEVITVDDDGPPLPIPQWGPVTPQISVSSMYGVAFALSSSCQSDIDSLCEDVGVVPGTATAVVPLLSADIQRQQIALRRKRSTAGIQRNGSNGAQNAVVPTASMRRRNRHRTPSPARSPQSAGLPDFDYQYAFSLDEAGLDTALLTHVPSSLRAASR